MKSVGSLLSLIVGMAFFVGCAPTPDQLKKVIVENPDIIFEAIEQNPTEFLASVNRAAKNAREEEERRLEEQERAAKEDEFKNPKSPVIAPRRAVKGPLDAPITIVEYSDFQCPFCRQGAEVVEKVLEDYGDQVRLVFKHYPIDRIHPQARMAARYFEAVAIQSPEQAYRLKNLIFENQRELVDGEAFLDSLVQRLSGVDLAKVRSDVNSKDIEAIIDADRAEAEQFGFTGTPGFLINGVSLMGFNPIHEFKRIIDRHMETLE